VSGARPTRELERSRRRRATLVWRNDATLVPVALEPASHMTDAFNRAARGAAATGTRILPPGSAFSCTMRIHARSSRPRESTR